MELCDKSTGFIRPDDDLALTLARLFCMALSLALAAADMGGGVGDTVSAFTDSVSDLILSTVWPSEAGATNSDLDSTVGSGLMRARLIFLSNKLSDSKSSISMSTPESEALSDKSLWPDLRMAWRSHDRKSTRFDKLSSNFWSSSSCSCLIRSLSSSIFTVGSFISIS